MSSKYLVFSGGGPAGFAFAGAVEQLNNEPEFSFKELKGVAGSSIGSIAALLVSLNYSPQETSQRIASLDLKKIKDGSRIPFSQLYRLLTLYGRYKGESLYDFIKDIIKEKCGRNDPENVTFSDLKNLGFKDLHIVTTKLFKENNVPTGKQKIFCYEKTPTTSVAAAIRASIAAPTYFARVRLKKVEKGKYVIDEKGDLFEDGGVLNNYAIDMFDKPKYMDLPQNNSITIINPTTLGLALRQTYQMNDKEHKPVKTPIADAHPFEYAEGLINSILNQTEDQKFENIKNRERTIQIDRLGVRLDDFDINEQTKEALIESGRQAVKAYFVELRNKHKQQTNVVNFGEKLVAIGKLWETEKPSEQTDAKPVQKSRCAIM